MEATCPFCNALFTTAILSARGKACPRCGELLPAALQSLPTTAAKATAAPGRLSNRAIGLGVLGGMLVIAGVGLVFALMTQDFRRKNDYKVQPADPDDVETAGDWTALGYLPKNCNLVAGIQLALIQKDERVGKLLKPPRPANLDFALGQLEKWSGLRAEDLDHAVVGVTFDGKLPQATVALKTNKPYDLSAIAKSLKAGKAADVHGRPVFAVSLQPFGEARLWGPDRHTLVVVARLDAVENKDLDQLPATPRDGSSGLSQPIQDLLRQRLGQNNAFWLAAHGDWDPLVKWLPRDKVPGGKSKDLDIFAKVKTFGVGVKLEATPVVLASLQAADEAHRQALEGALKRLEIADLRIAVPSADVPAADSLWLTVQRGVTMEELTRLLDVLPTKK